MVLPLLLFESQTGPSFANCYHPVLVCSSPEMSGVIVSHVIHSYLAHLSTATQRDHIKEGEYTTAINITTHAIGYHALP